MKAGERFRKCLRGEPIDRMPLVENSFWWDETVRRWQGEGLPKNYNYKYAWQDVIDLHEYFGLDMLANWWVRPYTSRTIWGDTVGVGLQGHTLETYEKILLPTLYDEPWIDENYIKGIKKLQSQGSVISELIIDGAFWEPREFMGIENHLYSFYDQPELYERIIFDMVNWQKRFLEYAFNKLDFDFVTIAEDMSYNSGSMISEKIFGQFIAPYYKQIVPLIKQSNAVVVVDSDGNIDELIRWFNELGVEGYLPLEKQAKVDVGQLQKMYPKTAFVGNFDKMVMDKGEVAMRREFERLLPCIENGRYVVSVDHQTPPSVSLDNYRIYIQLLKEYTLRAASKKK